MGTIAGRPTKYCSKCRVEKDYFTDFYPNGAYVHGECRDCARVRVRAAMRRLRARRREETGRDR